MSSSVLVDHTDMIGTITISRPEAMNALNQEVLEQLLVALQTFSSDPRIRVIVLQGGGEKAFVSGADINEFVGASVQDALAIAKRLRAVTDAMTLCPKTILGSIRGYCLGGGFELALACDIRIAADNALFGLPEIKLGILPGGGGTVRLTKLGGSLIAREMAIIGDPVGAQRLYNCGLLTSLHPAEKLAEATLALARKLSQRAPFALEQLKSSLNIAIEASMSNALDAEAKAFALCYSTKDKDEGARAFLEKRIPNFHGR
jgi:enoyl-CoA hydratase